jgi:hypothetical protein
MDCRVVLLADFPVSKTVCLLVENDHTAVVRGSQTHITQLFLTDPLTKQQSLITVVVRGFHPPRQTIERVVVDYLRRGTRSSQRIVIDSE